MQQRMQECDTTGLDKIQKYLIHYTDGGVCQFGVLAGKLITLYMIIQLIFTSAMINSTDYKMLSNYFYANVGIISAIFLAILFANSGLIHYIRNGVYSRGLFESCIPFFIFQILYSYFLWMKVLEVKNKN